MITARRERATALRVLIAEDDDASRVQLRDAVESLGHFCSTAHDGQSALELHHQEPFDVVLSDWLMPRMDGLALCRTVREEDRDTYTYFIFITSLSDREHTLLALREGADQFITKPIDFEELEARLVAAQRMTTIHQSPRGPVRSLDGLSDVPNRIAMQEALATARAHAARYHHRYAIALCDIDAFPAYNQRHGVSASDHTLRRVADGIRTQLRRGDTMYRYAGAELLVLLPEQDVQGAATAIGRVRSAIESMAIASDVTPASVVTISAGIAALSSTDHSIDDWFQRARHALRRAKEKGYNRIELAS